jgi:hypothetical protein
MRNVPSETCVQVSVALQQRGPAEHRRAEFKALFNQDLKVGRAWAIKEALRSLWHYK